MIDAKELADALRETAIENQDRMVAFVCEEAGLGEVESPVFGAIALLILALEKMAQTEE